eukprot:3335436-Rhodomonas_salina.3
MLQLGPALVQPVLAKFALPHAPNSRRSLHRLGSFVRGVEVTCVEDSEGGSRHVEGVGLSGWGHVEPARFRCDSVVTVTPAGGGCPRQLLHLSSVTDSGSGLESRAQTHSESPLAGAASHGSRSQQSVHWHSSGSGSPGRVRL